MSESAEIVTRQERPNFQTSAEARFLYDRVRTMTSGETVYYPELNQIIGQDVQAEGRNALRTARRMALRDDAIICDTIPNVGIKRLSDAEIVQSSSQTFMRVRRLAQRGAERLVAVNYDALTDEEKTRRNAGLSALAIIKLMGKPKSLIKIANASSGELPIARTLELFRGPR